MNALKDAIMNRRLKANPTMAEEPSAQQEGNAPGPDGGMTAESVLKMLPEEEKLKMFEMLKADLSSEKSDSIEPVGIESDDTTGMTDEAGELKSTPGEKQALKGEMNMDVANMLHDDRYTGDEKPKSISDRVKINIAKAFKGRK